MPNAAFTGSDRSNPLQQLTEIILAKGSLILFQPLIVHRKLLYHILSQHARSPNAKMRSPLGINAVTY